MGKKSILVILAAAISILACPSEAFAQRAARERQVIAGGYKPKQQPVKLSPDSLMLARRDSLHRADSLNRVDSLALLAKSSLERPAFSEARDSIIEVFENGQRNIYYYGNVSVKYQDMTLNSERMEYNLNTGVVHAYGVLDTITGEWVGRPVMKQGSKTYNMEEVRYNFNTRKANIKNMITSEDEGLLHGQKIKMMPDNSINMEHGKYTVCDLEHPHYYLSLSVARVVTEPSRKTVFGPACLVLGDVKLPFVGIPFGFVPKRPQRATGLLMPSFGEENARGFYARDAGMYFVFGDNLDLSVTGDYYTLGSWGIDINSRYKFNYQCNGSFALNYSYDKTGEKGINLQEMTNFGLKWNHQQDSKAHPGTSFSASVNFSSPKNSTYNSHSVNEAIQNQVSSSISYSRKLSDKINLSVNALHSQNSRDSSYTFTLPNISLSVSTFYPFKQKNRVGKEKPWEKISFGYSTSLQNKIQFYAREFGEEGFLDKFKNGMNHNFSIGLPSFQLMKYININPSVSYGQNWFFRAYTYNYNEESNKWGSTLGKQFSHFGITQTYGGSLNASTRLYGMFNFGKYHKIQAIRHVVSPSVSFSYSPDLKTHSNGWRSVTYTDPNGIEQTKEFNIYSPASGSSMLLNSAPSGKKSARMNFSVGNNLEAKVRDYADTTGKGSKKVKLIDQLSLSSSYDFLADSLNLNPVSMSMSTNLFGKVNLSANAGFDPYALMADGKSAKKVNKFCINEGQGLARMTNFSASASYSISGKGTIKGNDGQNSGSDSPADYYKRIYYHPVTGEYVPGGWLYYTNPNVPWSLNFSASFSYRKVWGVEDGKVIEKEPNLTETLNVSGNIKLTSKMAINASSGYDFKAKKLSTTQLSATYDLHCFNISLQWVPFGQWQSYNFLIRANAASLADLLRYRKSSSFRDN